MPCGLNYKDTESPFNAAFRRAAEAEAAAVLHGCKASEGCVNDDERIELFVGWHEDVQKLFAL